MIQPFLASRRRFFLEKNFFLKKYIFFQVFIFNKLPKTIAIELQKN